VHYLYNTSVVHVFVKKKNVAKKRRFQKIKELCSNRRMRGVGGGEPGPGEGGTYQINRHFVLECYARDM